MCWNKGSIFLPSPWNFCDLPFEVSILKVSFNGFSGKFWIVDSIEVDVVVWIKEDVAVDVVVVPIIINVVIIDFINVGILEISM